MYFLEFFIYYAKLWAYIWQDMFSYTIHKNLSIYPKLWPDKAVKLRKVVKSGLVVFISSFLNHFGQGFSSINSSLSLLQLKLYYAYTKNSLNLLEPK